MQIERPQESLKRLQRNTRGRDGHIFDATISLISMEEGNALRDRVLKSPNLAWRELHKGTPWHFHVGAIWNGEVVSTASFALDSEVETANMSGTLSVWRLRAMATRPDLQGKELGHRVVAFGIKEVKMRGGGIVWCEGRVSASGFYESCGFHSLKRVFENPGTGPHVAFVRSTV